jgi:hypothetical protein
MRKFLYTMVAISAFSLVSAAQVVPKGNVFFGYSYTQATLGSTSSFLQQTAKNGFNGWEGSLEGSVLPFISIVADVSGHYGSGNVHLPITCPTSGCTTSLHATGSEYNFLFGPRVSVSIAGVRPFAHALIGASHMSQSATGINESSTGFSDAIGGGVDIKLLPVIGWRFQGDYLQTRFFSDTQNTYRFSTGVVLRF